MTHPFDGYGGLTAEEQKVERTMTDHDFTGGHVTMLDGTHVPLSAEDARTIWARCEEADAKRRALMPDSMAALRMLQNALTRLRDEGWRDGIYCPKNGSTFAAIEFGSTGIFTGSCLGDWPDGRVLVGDGTSHPRGLLWKPLEKLTEAEAEKLRSCDEYERAAMDRQMRSFAAMDLDDHQ